MQREPIADRAHGKWRHVLECVGVPVKALSGKHGPCPFAGCGGKDRFRFDDKAGSGSFYCSQCGAGKGVEFAKRFMGVEFKEAVREIEKHLGGAVVMPTKAGQRDDDQKSATT
ncbi:primase-helicase zinc-binding domain-containing protein [Mesorhizobium sp. A556]